MASVNLCRDIAVYALSMAAEARCLFALGVVVLVLVELFWPDRLLSISKLTIHWPCAEAAHLALLRAVVLLEVVRVGSLVAAALFPALVVCGVAYHSVN
jgi:hypothetical protein